MYELRHTLGFERGVDVAVVDTYPSKLFEELGLGDVVLERRRLHNFKRLLVRCEGRADIHRPCSGSPAASSASAGSGISLLDERLSEPGAAA